MDCIVHEVSKSWTQLSDFHFHFHEIEDVETQMLEQYKEPPRDRG